MKTTRIAASVAMATFIAGAAQAGGFAAPVVVPPPVAPMAPPVVAGSPVTFSGGVTLGFGSYSFEQTDDAVEDDGVDALSLSGHVETRRGPYAATLDFTSIDRDIDVGDDTFEDFAPTEVQALGLHLGREFGRFELGAFVGSNRFEADDGTGDSELNSGRLYGVDATFRLSERFAFFAQTGRAEMEGDEDDTVFDGDFQRLGASADFGRLAVILDIEQGESPDDFEDSGDEGDYSSAALRVDYAVTDRFVASVGYDTMDITANTEDDGSEDTISLGVTYAFGADGGPRRFGTTYKPGLAAAWAETLD